MEAGKRFFILTETPEKFPSISAGHICYVSDFDYNRAAIKPGSDTKLPVTFLGPRAGLSYDVAERCVAELGVEEAELLHALPDDHERLRWFRERTALRAAQGVTVGAAVTVEEGGEKLKGVVRYVGQLSQRPSYRDPISAVFFGVELQGSDRGKGNVYKFDFQWTKFFTCNKDNIIIAPFSRVRLAAPMSLSPSVLEASQPEPEVLAPGDRVTYFIDSYCHQGMVVNVQDTEGIVQISADTGGEVEVPLHLVAKGEFPSEAENSDVLTEADSELYQSLSVNSLVELSLGHGMSYGIIRWIGSLPDRLETMAGLELEDDMGVSDGTFKSQRFFTCPSKRALFVKLSSCRPDSRFHMSDNPGAAMETYKDAEREASKMETVPPVSTEQISQLLIGRMKGIQGHCNSCYMDAALFSLFSCSSVLDSMLFKSTEPQDAPIQQTLLHGIVNPLRSKGFVEGRHIMKLRQQLQKHGYSRSFTTDEKDPEEFLSVIMHHILALDPLLKLSAGGKVQESYCYQIFLDQNHSLVLPTVQQLLEHSFHSARLKLAEIPSCFMLQMPRFGKKFKMFDKIIPSLELDITDLLSEGPQQCMLCGSLAQEECIECFKDPTFSRTGFKIFCQTCSAQVHSHPQRRHHHPEALAVPSGFSSMSHSLSRDKLELFAVLCIETSHYVSFVKFGPSSQDWIFFDSMADREGERDGFNIPEVHLCPEVAAYLEMPPAELANHVPRDMKGVAKRLFCDAYMYLYESTNMCLYR